MSEIFIHIPGEIKQRGFPAYTPETLRKITEG